MSKDLDCRHLQQGDVQMSLTQSTPSSFDDDDDSWLNEIDSSMLGKLQHLNLTLVE